MTWFRMDDGFAAHPKVERLRRATRGDDLAFSAAVTTWTMMGTDCAARRTDGEFSTDRATRVVLLSPAVVAAALEALVGVGLLERAGDEEWRFHDWSDYQPTREELEGERKANADRQKEWRRRQREARAAKEAERHTVSNGVRNGVTDGVTNAERNAVVSREMSRETVSPDLSTPRNGAPSRPVPSQPKTEDIHVPEAPATPDASGAVAPLSLLPSEAPKPDPVSGVFAHWQRATGKTRAHLDSKRRTIVARMLKTYTPEQVTRAIDGYAASPWHRGENDRGRAFLGLDLMLRDAEHVEAGWTLADKHVAAPAAPRAPAPPRPPPVEPLAYTRDPEVMRKAREFSAQLLAMNEARLAEEAEAKAARLRQADEERAALRTQRVGT